MKKLLIILLIFAVPLVSSCYFSAQKRYNEAKKEVDELNRKIEQVLPDQQKIETLKAEIQDIKKIYEMGLEGVESLPELVDKLYDKDTRIQDMALQIAIMYAYDGEESTEAFLKEAMPMILERLKDKDEEVRRISARVLSYITPVVSNFIPELIEALDDESPEVRMEIIHALGNIGPDAAQALPKLREMSENDVDAEVRLTALVAIKAIEGSSEPETDEAKEKEGN